MSDADEDGCQFDRDNRNGKPWAYFGIHEKLNKHSTKIELMKKDLDQNSEFRIKYPRGELGQSAGEAELFMIVEHVSGLLED
ncbi:MAG: hypothetical protein CM15mV103_360 [uncultured marine virus]|nr:MAG: hypothetical protein CM15mV103_360 [uncultured marine virus]